VTLDLLDTTVGDRYPGPYAACFTSMAELTGSLQVSDPRPSEQEMSPRTYSSSVTGGTSAAVGRAGLAGSYPALLIAGVAKRGTTSTSRSMCPRLVHVMQFDLFVRCSQQSPDWRLPQRTSR
jgi:hypothetical protein